MHHPLLRKQTHPVGEKHGGENQNPPESKRNQARITHKTFTLSSCIRKISEGTTFSKTIV